jgi:ribosomal protein S18 acetylase RimI-like enzyme
MSLAIRWAESADARGLAHLKHAVWPDDNPDPEPISRAFHDQDRCTLVAVEDGKLAGFVDSFVTISSDHVARWEIDLLAVHPRSRGRGIARALVNTACQEGSQRGITQARALTHINNKSVHSTFDHCGFTTDQQVYGLYVATQPLGAAPPTISPGLHLVSVMTLNYSGVWLEGALTPEAFLQAGAIRAHYGWDVAGAVIPESESKTTEAALRVGYELVGLYLWWVKSL